MRLPVAREFISVHLHLSEIVWRVASRKGLQQLSDIKCLSGSGTAKPSIELQGFFGRRVPLKVYSVRPRPSNGPQSRQHRLSNCFAETLGFLPRGSVDGHSRPAGHLSRGGEPSESVKKNFKFDRALLDSRHALVFTHGSFISKRTVFSQRLREHPTNVAREK